MRYYSHHSHYRECTPKKREDYAYVLDSYDAESTISHKKLKGKVAQLIGERYFILLEGLVKVDVEVYRLERVYVGAGPRDKIATILKRIGLRDLKPIARAEIQNTIEKSIENHEKRWVNFFNNAGPITSKLHILELLPGVGKKTMWEVIQRREKALFRSFNDIRERTGIDAVKAIAKRVIEELEGREKYNVFADVLQKEAMT